MILGTTPSSAPITIFFLSNLVFKVILKTFDCYNHTVSLLVDIVALVLVYDKIYMLYYL